MHDSGLTQRESPIVVMIDKECQHCIGVNDTEDGGTRAPRREDARKKIEKFSGIAPTC